MEKVKLTKAIPTKTIEIPGYKGSQVEVAASVLLQDVNADIQKGSEGEIAAATLALLIKSWNFTEEVDGKDVDAPITAETIKQYFTAQQSQFIVKAISEFVEELKKD